MPNQRSASLGLARGAEPKVKNVARVGLASAVGLMIGLVAMASFLDVSTKTFYPEMALTLVLWITATILMAGPVSSATSRG